MDSVPRPMNPSHESGVSQLPAAVRGITSENEVHGKQERTGTGPRRCSVAAAIKNEGSPCLVDAADR